jgi:hypothetical protein
MTYTKQYASYAVRSRAQLGPRALCRGADAAGETVDGIAGQTVDGITGETVDGITGQTVDGMGRNPPPFGMIGLVWQA